MKVGFIQYSVRRDPEENFRIIASYLQDATVDLWVLPELSLHGYLFPDRASLMDVAEPVPGGYCVDRMCALSRAYNCAMIFGMPEREGNRIYNTAVVVDGTYVGKYRKNHLSDFEKRFFDPGREQPVFSIRGESIGVQICFDLWFPEVSRAQVMQGAGLLCVLANFGSETTSRIAPVRAIENMMPLVMCNRIGHEQIEGMDADFLGKSMVVDREGNLLAGGEARVEQARWASVEPAHLRSNVICADLMQQIRLHGPMFEVAEAKDDSKEER